MVWLIITHLSTLFYVSSTRGGGQQFPRINRVCQDTIVALCVRSVFAVCVCGREGALERERGEVKRVTH